jgi:hypothetical protein
MQRSSRSALPAFEHSAFEHSAFEIPLLDRFRAGLQLGDRPGGGKPWATFQREVNCLEARNNIRDAATTH